MPDLLKPVGDIRDIPTKDLFIDIIEKKFSGVLVLEGSDARKAIVFDQSQPVSTYSNLERERIGQIIVGHGILTQKDLEELILRHKQSGMNLCELLEKEGVLNHALTEKYLSEQVVLRITDVFQWRNGKFKFTKDIPKGFIKTHIKESLPEICFYALKEQNLQTPNEKFFLPESKPYLVSNRAIPLSSIHMTPEELSIYKSITGVSTFKAILSSAAMPVQSIKSLLQTLYDMHLLKVPAAPEAEPAEKTLLASINKMLATIKTQTHFEVLGVAATSTTEEIKKKFIELVKKYHPDKFPHITDETQKKTLQTYFGHLTVAHDTLTNPDLRESYLSELELKKQGFDQDKVRDIVQSEIEYQKGVILLKKGRFKEAVETLAGAIKLYKDEPDYYVQLGWGMFKEGQKSKSESLVKKAMMHIQSALKLRPELPQAYYYLGMIEKFNADMEKAQKYFEKTLEFAPYHDEANSELRWINRRAQTQKNSGLLSGIFKK